MDCIVGENQHMKFLIDTGAEPNLIKEKLIGVTTQDNNVLVKLVGITKNPVYTLGTIKLNILGGLTHFHVVPNNFPIEEDGILGRDFLKQAEAKIDFKNKEITVGNEVISFSIKKEIISIPNSTCTIGNINIVGDTAETYIPEIITKKGISAREASENNKNWEAFTPSCDTTEVDLTLQVPTDGVQKLNSFKEKPDFSISNKDQFSMIPRVQEGLTKALSDTKPVEIKNSLEIMKSLVILSSSNPETCIDLHHPVEKTSKNFTARQGS